MARLRRLSGSSGKGGILARLDLGKGRASVFPDPAGALPIVSPPADCNLRATARRVIIVTTARLKPTRQELEAELSTTLAQLSSAQLSSSSYRQRAVPRTKYSALATVAPTNPEPTDAPSSPSLTSPHLTSTRTSHPSPHPSHGIASTASAGRRQQPALRERGQRPRRGPVDAAHRGRGTPHNNPSSARPHSS